jgi:hypothetical protein
MLETEHLFYMDTIQFAFRPNLTQRTCTLNSGESYRMEAFMLSNTKRDSEGGGSHADIAEAAADNQESFQRKYWQKV